MHPDRIRLMIFNTVFAIGGTERQVVTLAKGLDRSRFDLHLGCSRRSGPFLEELERLDLPITEFSIKRHYGLRTLRQQLSLARYLRRHRIDVPGAGCNRPRRAGRVRLLPVLLRVVVRSGKERRRRYPKTRRSV